MVPNFIHNMVRVGRKHPMAWRYLFNFSPTMSYKLHSHKLSEEARRVRSDLNTYGVAVTSAEELFGPDSCYSELLEAVALLESSMADQFTAARRSLTQPDSIGQKVFNVEMLGPRPIFDGSTVYARFALQNELLAIANAYFGMFTSLRYYNVWHTFATKAAPRESQLWHRDREDFHVLKLFLYLEDVDADTGPFNYVLGTHPKGSRKQSAPCFLEGGVERSDDRQMAEAVAETYWKQCTGHRGTIILADTRGYHKGGLARNRDRIMYTCMFTSAASQSEKLLRFPKAIPLPNDKEIRRALVDANQ